MIDAVFTLTRMLLMNKPQRHAGPRSEHGVAAACITTRALLWLGHLVAYDAANCRAGRCSQEAATADYVARGPTYDGTSSGTLVLC